MSNVTLEGLINQALSIKPEIQKKPSISHYILAGPDGEYMPKQYSYSSYALAADQANKWNKKLDPDGRDGSYAVGTVYDDGDVQF